jgi:hypothetical protein
MCSELKKKVPPAYQSYVANHSVYWETHHEIAYGHEIPHHNNTRREWHECASATAKKCCISLGPKANGNNITLTVLSSVFRFFDADSVSAFQRQERHWRNVNVVDQFIKSSSISGFQPPLPRSVTSPPHEQQPQEQPDPSCIILPDPDKDVSRSNDSMTIDDFELLHVLGKGAFGKVILVRKREGGQIFAIKVLKKDHVIAKKQVLHTKTERKVLQVIDHPFIVRLRYAFQNTGKLYLVMDFYSGGTLFQVLRQQRQFKEHQAKLYGAQLVLALAHLHTLHIVYRDLKLENILMDGKGFIALADFGLAREEVRSADDAKTFCGTPEYLAPEILQRKPYGKSVDWWSFGIVMFEMLSGSTPFYHPNRKQNFYNILHEPLDVSSKHFSDTARSLLRGLLCRDPSQRLGTHGGREVMLHPFFADVPWRKLYRRQVRAPFVPNRRNEAKMMHNRLDKDAENSIVNDAAGANVPPDAFMDFTYRCTELLENSTDSDT